MDKKIQMRDQGATKQIMGMEVYIDGNDSDVSEMGSLVFEKHKCHL